MTCSVSGNRIIIIIIIIYKELVTETDIGEVDRLWESINSKRDLLLFVICTYYCVYIMRLKKDL